MNRLTRAGFKEWLESFRPRQIVGVSDSNTICPLAKFTGKCNQDWDMLPEWARQFVAGVDVGPLRHRITAARALKILESIK